MQCELCGRDNPACRQAIIDGVDMILCPSCLNKHGQSGRAPSSPRQTVHEAITKRARRRQQKDIFNEIKQELIDDWSEEIQRARQKKGLSREQLGFNIGEPTTTIAKLEKGDLRPSDKMVKKIEKELDIHLTEEKRKQSNTFQQNFSGGSTLGDFIKRK